MKQLGNSYHPPHDHFFAVRLFSLTPMSSKQRRANPCNWDSVAIGLCVQSDRPLCFALLDDGALGRID